MSDQDMLLGITRNLDMKNGIKETLGITRNLDMKFGIN